MKGYLPIILVGVIAFIAALTRRGLPMVSLILLGFTLFWFGIAFILTTRIRPAQPEMPAYQTNVAWV